LDTRTTVMLRNIPFHLKVENIQSLIWEVCRERVDFIYLPLHNRQLGRNCGYAFVNFITTDDLATFYTNRNGHSWSVRCCFTSLFTS
ncbi:hypothetical protein BDP27DRAFT_1234103, partial [Rhodocollybia butyracea]